MNQHKADSSLPVVAEKVFGIRRGEFPAVAWSFTYFFCILSSYYILRPVRDAMAIVSGVPNIVWLFTGTFAVMLFAAPAFGWIASRFPRKQFLPWIYYFFVSNILIFFLLFTYFKSAELDLVWIGRVFFVWLSVFNLFVVTVFWSFMADIYSKEQSRRLFGVIAAGGSIGAFLGPVITASLVVPLGFENLLPISALLLLCGVACIYQLRKWVRTHDESPSDYNVESSESIGGNAFDGIKETFANPYFAAIATILILANFVGVVAYTYMAEVVSQTFATTDEQTQIFAWIDAAINLLSFLGTLFLVKQSVQRLGIGATLALLPIVSVIGFALLAIHPVFAVMAGLQIFRRALTFGFTKPSTDMLYGVVTPAEKYKVKNFIDTAIYRSGDLIAIWAIRLLGTLGVGISGLAIISIPISLIWTGLAFWVGRRYYELDRQQPDKEPS